MVIGVDLDEVLAEYLSAFISFHNDTYGTALQYDDFYTYKLWMVAKFTREETMKRIHEFHRTDYFKNIQPVEGAIAALSTLKARGHKLIVISSRQSNIESQTKEWLNLFFPGVFSKVYVLNNFGDVHGIYRTKSSVCKELGVDIMIEDAVDYAKECACADTRVILLDKPWNRLMEESPFIVRTSSWTQVLEHISEAVSQ
jgi:uncharacterized HAD superfamily protein